jgi:hypothetical protein
MEHQNQRWLILQRYTQPSADTELLISETETGVTGVAESATTVPHCAERCRCQVSRHFGSW